MSEPRDQELEDHLAGKSGVSRLYRAAPAEEPPSALDARIKAAARAGLTPRRPRWMLPLSAAAVLMLSVSVLLRMQQEGVTPIPVEEAATGALPAEPAPAARLQAPAESAPVVTETAPAASAPGVDSPAAEKRSGESQDTSATPFPVPAQRQTQPQTADDAGSAQNRDEAEGQMSSPAPANDAARAGQSTPVRDPADWIEYIRRLRTEGRDTEAAAELQAFRERYPEYTLPEDLR